MEKLTYCPERGENDCGCDEKWFLLRVDWVPGWFLDGEGDCGVVGFGHLDLYFWIGVVVVVSFVVGIGRVV